MRDPREMYQVEEDVAAELGLRSGSGEGPVMLHVLEGFVDAGEAGAGVVAHLAERFGATRLATFEVDELVDYRARRPVMTFDSTRWTAYDAPHLALDVVRDAEGVPFLLLHGSEPDVQWERYVAAVTQLVERFGVRLTVGVNGVPMGVPHTRPVGMTVHGTRTELVADHPSWFGRVQVPGSAAALLELRLGELGHDAVGVAVHVPHYLAQSAYPQASVAALDLLERRTGLQLDPAVLEPVVRAAASEVERQVGESAEVAAVVAALEEQYDSFTRAIGRTNLLAESTDLPTAEELGAEFERFLAQQEGPGRPS
ncbi:PAC2 family protein [Cellulomonas bogoriensis]|uniref:Proteasome protein n=1 Tax=Cellulomonas bogoriensis 69B4 = DSM 16987 TaxID=1386082 RepID=A0A0A0BZE1_9CELL|nr:PAC2 family protein [Cellulomonas bogoriensis]KGM13305.1 proteasome protein [Cellulomonas bogoriensis 69B4 = DSM 16987]